VNPFADLDCKTWGKPLRQVNGDLWVNPGALNVGCATLNRLDQYRTGYTRFARQLRDKGLSRANPCIIIKSPVRSFAHCSTPAAYASYAPYPPMPQWPRVVEKRAYAAGAGVARERDRLCLGADTAPSVAMG